MGCGGSTPYEEPYRHNGGVAVISSQPPPQQQQYQGYATQAQPVKVMPAAQPYYPQQQMYAQQQPMPYQQQQYMQPQGQYGQPHYGQPHYQQPQQVVVMQQGPQMGYGGYGAPQQQNSGMGMMGAVAAGVVGGMLL